MSRDTSSVVPSAAQADHRSSDYLPFTTAHRLFYDVPWAPGCDDSVRVTPTAGAAPPGWTVCEQGPWTAFRGPGPLPAAGWKVHVSTVPQRATEIVGRVVRIAFEQGVAVKALRTLALVRANQEKYAPLTASGKVVAAYPVDEPALVRLVEALVAELRGEPGPGITGELAIAGAPVFVRYGAFTDSWLVTETGVAVPARRSPEGLTPDRRGPGGGRGQQPPSGLRPLLAPPAMQRLDVSAVSLVHRSNAGGVYRATWGDGRPVVLKEARRYAGLDAGGVDATTRLRHERDVLLRLSDVHFVPNVHDYVALGDSEFLVMSKVEGTTVAEALATRHPAHCPDATPESARRYVDWIERTVSGLTELVRTLAEHGVAHGDLHPSNILETAAPAAPHGAAGLVLVDFESASLDGHQVATGVAAPGFGDGGPASLAGDLAAIGQLRLTLLNSAAQLLSWSPQLRRRIEAAGWADVQAATQAETRGQPREGVGRWETAVGPERGPGVGPTVPREAPSEVDPELIDSLVAGLRRVATPERTDRLFPGDIAGFTRPDGGLGLLHGAAGVVLAVHATGRPVPQEWLQWLAQRARQEPEPTGGLAHGELGVALALAQLGRHEEALAVTRRALSKATSRPRAPWWEHGCAGRAVAYAELARLLDLPAAAVAAADHARDCLRAVAAVGGSSGAHPDPSRLETELGHAPGLLRGWAGVSLALLRLIDLDLDAAGRWPISPSPEPDGLSADLHGAAVQAVLLDARHTRLDGGALTARHGRRLRPYLGVGAAAIGLAAHSALDRWPGTAPAGADDPSAARLAELAQGVVVAARLPQVVGAGLLDGRAGILAVLRRMAGDEHPSVPVHAERLRWHAIDVAMGARCDQPRDQARVLTGSFGLRLSGDLATGSAGALLALAGGDPLGEVLGMPRAVPPAGPR